MAKVREDAGHAFPIDEGTFTGRVRPRFLDKVGHETMYSKVSIIGPGRSRLLEFEKKIVLVI